MLKIHYGSICFFKQGKCFRYRLFGTNKLNDYITAWIDQDTILSVLAEIISSCWYIFKSNPWNLSILKLCDVGIQIKHKESSIEVKKVASFITEFVPFLSFLI